jgi:Ca2+-binding EF-hand superfamily protein
MATDALTTRYEKLFDAFDTDNDGTVEPADFNRAIERITKSYHLSEHDSRAQEVKMAYITFSSQLMRRNDNGRLSKDQFVTALHALVDDSSRMDVVEVLSGALFNIANQTHGYELSQDEFQYLAKAAGDAAPPTAWDAFAQLDADSDGVISRKEFVHGVREFLTNPDTQTAVGGIVLGVK